MAKNVVTSPFHWRRAFQRVRERFGLSSWQIVALHEIFDELEETERQERNQDLDNERARINLEHEEAFQKLQEILSGLFLSFERQTVDLSKEREENIALNRILDQKVRENQVLRKLINRYDQDRISKLHTLGITRQACEEYIVDPNVASLLLVFLDVNDFKSRINFEFGRPVGTQVIRAVGRMIGQLTRGIDVKGRTISEPGSLNASRWGGDEFVIIAPLKSEDLPFQLIRRIRDHLEDPEYQANCGVSLPFSLRFSIGAVHYILPKDRYALPPETQYDKLIDAADALTDVSKEKKPDTHTCLLRARLEREDDGELDLAGTLVTFT
ncbi:MAG: GGDEF domain-containing protein [Candidatus Doudnabacteria bacterium]|nr:GGDEF domain-containing protein [Candidatus Doudnabacteria bacterium]